MATAFSVTLLSTISIYLTEFIIPVTGSMFLGPWILKHSQNIFFQGASLSNQCFLGRRFHRMTSSRSENVGPERENVINLKITHVTNVLQSRMNTFVPNLTVFSSLELSGVVFSGSALLYRQQPKAFDEHTKNKILTFTTSNSMKFTCKNVTTIQL